MIRYLALVVRHRLRAERSLSLLTVGGVAVGVGSVVLVQILSASAITAFDTSLDLLNGDADVVVLGNGGSLDEALYPVVLATDGVADAAPVLERTATLADGAGAVQVYGLDLLSGRTSWLTGVPDGDGPRDTPPRGRADRVDSLDRQASDAPRADPAGPVPDVLSKAIITRELAERLGLEPGDTVEINHGSQSARIALGATLSPPDGGPSPGPALIMDIALAQVALGEEGRISQINVTLAPDRDREEFLEGLSAALGSRAILSSTGEQRQEATQLLAAFRLNLSALSLISVFVGLFLVYGTTRASLIRRRTEIGVLRSLGATRIQVLGVLLAEVASLALVGIAIGLPLGIAGARANLDSVSQTVTNLYLLEAIQTLDVPLWIWLLGAVGGLAGAMAGALGPAIEVAGATITELLSARKIRRQWRSRATRLAGAGWGVVTLVLAWFALGGRHWQHSGLVLAAAIMVWITLVTPHFVAAACGALTPPDFGWRFAVRSLAVRLHTSGVAVAGVAIAMSMLVGITVMVGSFRDTFRVWLDTTIRADMYLSAAAWRGDADMAGIDPEIVEAIGRLSGVRAVDRLRGFSGVVDGRPVSLRAVDFRLASLTDRYLFLEGDAPTVFSRVANGAVAIGEPLARSSDKWSGDSISVRTARGTIAVEIAGVYYEYGSERGSLTMDLTTMERWFGPGQAHSIGVYFTPGGRGAAAGVRQAVSGYPITVRANRELRANAIRIFDQTFAITLLLQGMALFIAAAGVTLSLLVIAREEARETLVYRALGATQRQVFRLFLGKGAGLAGLGAALGMVGGLALGVTLIYVTNRAYFGWTVQFRLPVLSLAQQGATLAATAVVASWIPARRVAGNSVTSAREAS